MSGPFPDTRGARDDWQEPEHILRGTLALLTTYLVAMLLPMAMWTRRSTSPLALLLHLAAIALVVLAHGKRLPVSLRYWTPLALGPFLYIELRWLVAGAGRPHADGVVAGWEGAVFPANPSTTLAVDWHAVALSEMLHAAYLSYYALIFVPPILLWFAGRRLAFSKTLLALAVVYALCFTIYVLFPVDGPRFLHGPSLAPNGPVRSIVVALLESGSSRGTAFPSSHVAASVVASVCALRFQRRLGFVVALLTAGVCIGAVYGGYHYAIDIVGGLVAGAVALGIARTLEARSTAAPPLADYSARR
jgi:membrane-associated phospholipid phosphatase